MSRTSSVLTDEIRVLETLIDLADQKKKALLHNELDLLQKVIEEEEAAAKRLSQLEETRLQQAGLSATGDQTFEDDRRKMAQLLRTLKSKNEFNQAALGDALAYTRFSIQLITGLRQPSVMYGAEGKIQDVTQRRLIDTKG